MNNVVNAKEFTELTDKEQGEYLFFDENYRDFEIKVLGKGKCAMCEENVETTYLMKEEGVILLCKKCFIVEFSGGVFVREEFTEKERQAISALLLTYVGDSQTICSEEELQTLINKV